MGYCLGVVITKQSQVKYHSLFLIKFTNNRFGYFRHCGSLGTILWWSHKRDDTCIPSYHFSQFFKSWYCTCASTDMMRCTMCSCNLQYSDYIWIVQCIQKVAKQWWEKRYPPSFAPKASVPRTQCQCWLVCLVSVHLLHAYQCSRALQYKPERPASPATWRYGTRGRETAHLLR